MTQIEHAPEAALPVATTDSRADFMRDEGTALFTRLTQDILVPVINDADAAAMCKQAGEYPSHFPVDDPIENAAMLTHAHTRLLQFGYNTIRQYSSISSLPDNTQVAALQVYLQRFTYERAISGLMSEAHATLLNFPLNLLRYGQNTALDNNLSPVVGTFEDIPRIYRSDWFYNACRSAAITGNGHWQGFSTGICRLVPMDLDKASLDLTFENHGNLSTFGLSSSAKQFLTGLMRRKNEAVPEGIRPEKFENGSTSGCPVTRKKPLFNPSNPSDMARLQGVADFVGTDPQELMSFDKTGIATGLEATADMFERCIPVMERLARDKEKKRELCRTR